MIHGIILTDNNFTNHFCARGYGAHRIASHLRTHGYDIEVVDYCLSWTQEEYKQLLDKLVTDKTIFLGIGTNLFNDDRTFDKKVAWIKENYPQLKIVVGGNNVLTRSIPYVDYYIDGYAENSMLALLDFLRGKITELDVKWSNFSSSNNFINSIADYGQVDTNDLRVEYLPSDFLRSKEVLSLETARGCIFKCKFCTYVLIGKKKLDYLRDPETVITELKTNYDKWGITNYFIAEDTFNDSIEKLEMLEKAITRLPFKIQFTSYARIDLIAAKPHSVELLKNMGMRGVHFGIETFSAPAGKLIGKSLVGNKSKDTLLWWKEQTPDISTLCTMIVGLPNDDSDYHAENNWFATSGINSWFWQPLYIVKEDATINTSEFSRSWRDYGLEYMTDSEIYQEYKHLAKLEVLARKNKLEHNYEKFFAANFKEKVAFWRDKANGKTYFDYIKLATDLNNNIKNKRVSSWDMMFFKQLGYELDEIMTWGGDGKPEPDVFDLNKLQIQEYIANKLAYDYKSYYRNSNKLIKRFIPITNNL